MKSNINEIILFLAPFVIWWLFWLGGEIRKLTTTKRLTKNFLSTNLAIISLYHNSRKLNFVVDSGSTCSIIDEAVFDELSKCEHLKVEKTSCARITFSDTSDWDSFTTNIKMSDKKGKANIYEQQFYVSNLSSMLSWDKEEFGEKIHGVLGIDFLVKYGFTIDFSHLVMYKQ